MASADRTWDDRPVSTGPTDGGAPPADSALVSRLPERYDRAGVQVLGQGGLGTVYAVRDTLTGRQVALKVLHAGQRGGKVSRGLVRRFLREARITAQLAHPGVVPVYEIGHFEDGSAYYTMKRVRGRTLEDTLAGAATLRERLALVPDLVQVTQAVAYAHSRGVVHRDLKPANVMVGEFGETLVLDWGIARLTGDVDDPDEGDPVTDAGPADRTVVGTVMGTPAYMSPEQARGDLDALDARSDVWSLGVMLFQVVCGRRPFDGPDVLDAVRHGVAPRVREVFPEAPPELAAIADRCLSAAPDDRYPTAADLARDLEAWLGGGAVTTYQYGLGERVRRAAGRFRSAGVAALLTAAALGAVGVVGAVRLLGDADLARSELRAALLREADARAPLDPAGATEALRGALALGHDADVRGALLLAERRFRPALKATQRPAGCEIPTVVDGLASCAGTAGAPWPDRLALPGGGEAVARDDGTLQLRDPAGVWTSLPVGDGPGRLAAARDGRVVVDVRRDGAVTLVDPLGAEVLARLPGRAARADAVALDGATLARITSGGAREAWDLGGEGALRGGIFARGAAPDELVPFGDELLAFSARDQSLRRFDPVTGDERGEPVGAGGARGVAAVWPGPDGSPRALLRTAVGVAWFSPADGLRAFATPPSDRGVVVFDPEKVVLAAEGAPPVLWALSEARELVRFERPWARSLSSAPSRTVLVETPEGRVAALDLDSQRLTPIPEAPSLAGAVLTPDVSRLAVPVGAAIRVIEVATGARAAEIETGSPPVALALSPAGDRVAWAGPDGRVALAGLDGALEARAPAAGDVRWIRFAADGLWWATADRVFAWDLPPAPVAAP